MVLLLLASNYFAHPDIQHFKLSKKPCMIFQVWWNHLYYQYAPLTFQKGNCVEKLVFILSIAGVMLCGFGIVSFPWILPYFYTATIPFLMGLRIWLYWEAKWQLFLVDFCYVTNLLLFIYLWWVFVIHNIQFHGPFCVIALIKAALNNNNKMS